MSAATAGGGHPATVATSIAFVVVAVGLAGGLCVCG